MKKIQKKKAAMRAEAERNKREGEEYEAPSNLLERERDEDLLFD